MCTVHYKLVLHIILYHLLACILRYVVPLYGSRRSADNSVGGRSMSKTANL